MRSHTTVRSDTRQCHEQSNIDTSNSRHSYRKSALYSMAIDEADDASRAGFSTHIRPDVKRAMPRAGRNSREEMLIAAGGDEPAFKPRSVQQAPGKRGERPPSYRSGMEQMNQKLSAAQPKNTPAASWFVAGVLLFAVLYWYNALSA